MRFVSLSFAVVAAFMLWGTPVHAISLNEHPKVKQIADELVSEGHYSEGELDAIFSAAVFKQNVLDAMTSPAEYKFTWGKYRKLFLKEDRIQQGAEFWLQHRDVLAKAEAEYGVPASIIVSIIGVESKFGKFKGKYKVLDSLVTLVSGFPRRSKFFASELKHFLILSKENKLDPTNIYGSYAGAVGYPQFISSSYRNYAVDFSGDGSVDLINQVEDAIGSIANYFIENGWKPGQPVTSIAYETVPSEIESLANRKRKVQYSAQQLRAGGAALADGIADDEKLGVLMLDASEVVRDKEKPGTYIVRVGDTACQIAERYKVSCKQLFKLNNLDSKGTIYRGQRLKLPNSATSTGKSRQKKLVKSKGSKWEVARVHEQSAPSTQTQEPVDESMPRYFYTHHNFYAITKYNHSVLYAMAVYDLSRAIELQYAELQN